MTDDQKFWMTWGAQVGAAVATLLAVTIALFKDAILGSWFPPKLKAYLKNPLGERTKITLPEHDKILGKSEALDARYYYLTVCNERRWSPARNVQVYLLTVEEPGPNGNLQVVWQSGVPIQWRHHEIYAMTRTIGQTADCDMLSIVKKRQIAHEQLPQGYLVLHPMIKPNNLRAEYHSASKLVLSFQARGDEAESNIVRIRISWTGDWEDGDLEMARSLVVEEIPGPEPAVSPARALLDQLFG